MNGALGNDELNGGSGHDSIVFSTRLGTASTDRHTNFDVIAGFSSGLDRIVLDDSVFTQLRHHGHLKKANFATGRAKDGNDFILYDRKTGILSYDSDGSGTAEAVEFAKIKKPCALTHGDFFVI